MTTKRFTFSLELSVHDAKSLRQAAELRAIDGGMTAEDWQELRASEFNPMAADIQMLLDPGSLPGCDIEQSSVESLSGWSDDEDEDSDEDDSEPKSSWTVEIILQNGDVHTFWSSFADTKAEATKEGWRYIARNGLLGSNMQVEVTETTK